MNSHESFTHESCVTWQLCTRVKQMNVKACLNPVWIWHQTTCSLQSNLLTLPKITRPGISQALTTISHLCTSPGDCVMFVRWIIWASVTADLFSCVRMTHRRQHASMTTEAVRRTVESFYSTHGKIPVYWPRDTSSEITCSCVCAHYRQTSNRPVL